MNDKEKTARLDGRYEIKRTIPGQYSSTGKPFRKSFYSAVSKNDCISQYDAYLLELGTIKGKGDQLPSEKIIFREWARMWLETYKKGNVKDNTFSETYKRTVNNYLIPVFGDKELSAIKPYDIQLYINSISDKYSNTTLSKIRLCLNGMYEKAIDNGSAQKNPAKNIVINSTVQNTKKRTYTQEQYNDIIEYTKQHKYGLPVRLLLEVGLRCSEMCGLTYADIDYDTKTLHIKRTCTTVNYRPYISTKMKNASSKRSLPITTALCEYIRQCSVSHDINDYIASGTSNAESPNYYSKHKYRTFFMNYITDCKKEDLEKLTPHELRHTCGTLLYARSHDIYAVSKYLGHSNIDITVKTYVHESADILRENLGIE